MPKQKTTLTMNQMAKELNLSRRVISAVVNDRCEQVRVSAATEKRVRDYLEAAGYVRSLSALQLKDGGACKQIGILYCGKFIDLEYLVSAMSILTSEIRSRCGFSEISGVEPDRLYEGVSAIIAKGIRKLIWIHANTPQEEFFYAEKLFPLFRRLEKVVIFKYDFLYPALEESYLKNGIELVGFDSAKSYRQAAALFHRLGHTSVALNDITHIGNKPLPGNDQFREAFLAEGLQIFGVQPPPECDKHNIALEIANEIEHLYHNQGVRAAFIRNDLLCQQVMHILQERGLRIPDDIGMIGFSGSAYSGCNQPPLTTFVHPIEAMCRKTMELIDSESASVPGQRHIFENRLILRQSHAPSATGTQNS